MSIVDFELFKTPYAVIDVETTGLCPRRDRVLEVGVVVVAPGSAPTVVIDTLVNPGTRIHNTQYHQICDDDVRDAPTFEEIAPLVVAALANRIAVAHNGSFDFAFLREELLRAGYPGHCPYLCTMELDKLTTSEPRISYSRALGSLAARYHLGSFEEHRASSDALAAAKLLRHHLKRLKKMGVRTFDDVRASGAALRCAESFVERPMATPSQLGTKRTLRPRVAAPDRTGSALARYLDAVLVAIADLHVSEAELEEVARIREALGIADEEMRAVHARVFSAMIDRYTEDRKVDTRETRNLEACAASLRRLGWCPGDSIHDGG